jgi:hypothetical protein
MVLPEVLGQVVVVEAVGLAGMEQGFLLSAGNGGGQE